jgi:folylpolyglutamate synthase/dihydropteroate synthase
MQTLGETLAAIAWEKGGVFKVPGCACFAAPQLADPKAAQVGPTSWLMRSRLSAG